MAIAHFTPILPPCVFFLDNLHNNSSKNRQVHCHGLAPFKNTKRSSNCSYEIRVLYGSQSRRRGVLLAVNREVSDLRNSNVQARAAAFVEIPVTCYQILGIPDQSEKDEIVKSVMHLKNAEIDEGYTNDAIVSRQSLLMDVRDKLLFEPDYAGNTREKIPPRSSLHIPWAWLPGALCLLEEVGEEMLALDIGRTALLHPDAKPYSHDLLLSMALAECAIAKVSFEKNKISQGYEALARAQCLLRSKTTFGKLMLLLKIEESLEELAPACTLELLGMPQTPENAERRLGAVAALRELLRQGLGVETSCQVQDWPSFLNQALKKLMATEIVELHTWDNLATIRKNKKSIESQNQRVVVDLNCFYMVFVAHIAVGFSMRQTDMIIKAETICKCLLASDSIDLNFEETFCSFLLGKCNENVAAERLQQVELNLNSTSQNLITGKDIRDVPSAKKSLESWLKSAVLGLFPDTRDCSPSLENFIASEKKVSEAKLRKRAPQTSPSVSHRPLSPGFTSVEDFVSTSRHLRPAVKHLTASNLQGPMIASNASSESNLGYPAVQLKRNLGANSYSVWEVWLRRNNAIGYLSVITATVCILFATFKLMGMQSWWMRSASCWLLEKPSRSLSSLACATDSSLDFWGSACIKGNSIANRLKRLLSIQTMQFSSLPEAAGSPGSHLDASVSSSMTAAYKMSMNMEEAETLVKQWQAIKAEALGPNHQVHILFDVLDELMLVQWKALAEAAKAKPCFWRFVLLQLSILRADIFLDGMGKELAEIEAFLEEAAELVDVSQARNPNYYSTYTIRYFLKRQDNGSWRFCDGDIQIPS